jgi:hypothetical protein
MDRPDNGSDVSYDLNLTSDSDSDLDLDLARRVFGGDPDCDEVNWLRDTLAATILLTPEEIDVGIAGDDAPQADRARDFAELLRVVLDLADQLGADVYDPQLGRQLALDDLPEAIRGFA